MSEQRTVVENPETVVSDWKVSFRCPVNGRHVTVTSADFSARCHYSKNVVNLTLLTNCLCGGMHVLEVE